MEQNATQATQTKAMQRIVAQWIASQWQSLQQNAMNGNELKHSPSNTVWSRVRTEQPAQQDAIQHNSFATPTQFKQFKSTQRSRLQQSIIQHSRTEQKTSQQDPTNVHKAQHTLNKSAQHNPGQQIQMQMNQT